MDNMHASVGNLHNPGHYSGEPASARKLLMTYSKQQQQSELIIGAVDTTPNHVMAKKNVYLKM